MRDFIHDDTGTSSGCLERWVKLDTNFVANNRDGPSRRLKSFDVTCDRALVLSNQLLVRLVNSCCCCSSSSRCNHYPSRCRVSATEVKRVTRLCRPGVTAPLTVPFVWEPHKARLRLYLIYGKISQCTYWFLVCPSHTDTLLILPNINNYENIFFYGNYFSKKMD